MSEDLATQIGAYVRAVDQAQLSVTLDDLTDRGVSYEMADRFDIADGSFRDNEASRVSRRKLMLAAAAAMFGVVVGLFFALTSGDDRSAPVFTDDPELSEGRAVTSTVASSSTPTSTEASTPTSTEAPPTTISETEPTSSEVISAGGVFPVGSAVLDVAASDSLLVAVGGTRVFCCGSGVDGDVMEGSSAAVWTSTDGVKWVRVPHDESVFPNTGEAMHGVTATSDGFVAVGAGRAIWESADGRSWTRVRASSGGRSIRQAWMDVVDTPSGVIAYGDGSSLRRDFATQWSSTGILDGLGATTLTSSGLISFGHDADDRSTIMRSTDGLDWTQETVSAFAPYLGSVLADDDGYLGADILGNLWRSADGLVWTHELDVGGPLFGQRVLAVTRFGDGYVGVGVAAREGFDVEGIAGPILSGAQVDDPTPKIAVGSAGLVTAQEWSLAVFPLDEVADVSQMVDAVRDWDGVADVVHVPADAQLWATVAGLASIDLDNEENCRPGSLCVEGFLLLADDDLAARTIRDRLLQAYDLHPAFVVQSGP